MAKPDARIDTLHFKTPDGRYVGRVVLSWPVGNGEREKFFDGSRVYDTPDRAEEGVLDELSERMSGG